MYEIKWASIAFDRYISILNYWIEHNESDNYSLKIIDEVERIEKLLVKNSELGNIVFSSKETVRKILVLENFSIFYIVKGDIITFVFFMDNREDPKKIKSEIKKII